MDSPDKMESEPSFPKISSDAAHRTYRRPRSNSASSDESPKHERNKNHDSSKFEREIERVKSHNRSERENERHSDRHSRGRHDDYKSHNHGKRYDNYDYKSRSKDERRRKDDDGDRDRERKDRYDRDRERKDDRVRESKDDRDRERKDDRVRERKDDRDRERKDYYEKRNERENEKRKHTESVEVKQRESKFSRPENKDVEEKAGSSSNQAGTDLNAAKAAAMKAADSVNKNIGGVAGVGGALTTEQKKKLLWGNKKTQPTQDITKNWDLNLFADRERQEKFNKLMGVKGNQNQETKSEEVPDVKKREEKLEIDLEKQYTAGLRRRDGRTVGLGL